MRNTFKLRDEFEEILSQPLIEQSCLRVLEIIKFIGEVDHDDELAHSMEDDFREVVLKSIDHPLAKLALRTSEYIFARLCS